MISTGLAMITTHSAAEDVHNLLVIDDEPEIVKALRRQFRHVYNVYVASTAAEGHKIMEKVSIQAIISDQRMPGMSGSAFFQQIKHEFPDAIRLLLTGYADIQAVISAINDGNVFRYITKPWDPTELDTIVHEAFVRHDLIMRNRQLVADLTQANEQLEDRVQQRTAELSASNAQLQLVSAEKDKFMGMLAHDLRGPLGNLRMCTALLREPKSSAKDREFFLRTIEDVSGKMLDLVNDLLDINTIESGQLVLAPKAVEIGAFIERVCRLNSCLGESKQIALVADVDPVLDMMFFDPHRIEQVLDNLINNAFKFSHVETTVTIKVVREGDSLLIAVSDQGQGIQVEELPLLFRAFQKTSTQPTANERSTGLGLSICKRIVELHGGAMMVSSDYGVGTTFTIQLPYERDNGE